MHANHPVVLEIFEKTILQGCAGAALFLLPLEQKKHQIMTDRQVQIWWKELTQFLYGTYLLLWVCCCTRSFLGSGNCIFFPSPLGKNFKSQEN